MKLMLLFVNSARLQFSAENLTENENEMKLKDRDPATCNGYDRAICYNC